MQQRVKSSVAKQRNFKKIHLRIIKSCTEPLNFTYFKQMKAEWRCYFLPSLLYYVYAMRTRSQGRTGEEIEAGGAAGWKSSRPVQSDRNILTVSKTAALQSAKMSRGQCSAKQQI